MSEACMKNGRLVVKTHLEFTQQETAEIRAAMKAADGAGVPTEPGFYWCDVDTGDEEVDGRQVVEVRDDVPEDDDELRFVIAVEMDDVSHPLSAASNWSAKLEDPACGD